MGSRVGNRLTFRERFKRLTQTLLRQDGWPLSHSSILAVDRPAIEEFTGGEENRGCGDFA